MTTFGIQTLESDLHRLDLRFASLRMRQPRMIEHLARSIEQSGQLVPVVAVAETQNQWILIDGYRRIAALRRLSRDTARVDLWDCPLAQALLFVLVRVQDRNWEAIEEGALIQELITRFGLSQREVAGQTGRDVSWVSRRLSLIQALPEEVLAAVRRGKVSSWAATRVLMPLARANAEHATILLAQLEQHPFSTRELKDLYSHYRQANQVQRQRLVEKPELFLRARNNRQEAAQAKRLAEGLEGAWCKDLAVVKPIFDRWIRKAPALFEPAQNPEEKKRLQKAFAPVQAAFVRLQQTLEEVAPQ